MDKKLVIVPEEAETVRLIFKLYLELGSLKRLAEELDRRGLRTKRQVLSNGKVKVRGGCGFWVGPLRYLLKNRFYIGEVVYRGEVCPGEHEPILDRVLFEAVQEKLKDGAVARRIRRSRSPAILSGKFFDDRGNRMSPSHANKNGVRYRYYVSQALLQGRGGEAGSVARVSAPDVEQIVLKGLREHLAGIESAKEEGSIEDRHLIERHVERVVVRDKTIEILLRGDDLDSATEETGTQDAENHDPGDQDSITLALPWAVPVSIALKGILHEPKSAAEMTPAARDVLLIAIARAKIWIDDLVSGKAASFAEIAEREGKVERHIRFLAPLAFVSPWVVAAIASGSAAADLTVSALAKGLALSWIDQRSRFIGIDFGCRDTSAVRHEPTLRGAPPDWQRLAESGTAAS